MSTIRLATEHDAAAIRAIYAPLVTDSIVSFETEPPTEAEMRRRIVDTTGEFPWLLWEANNEILGYAYADEHRSRAAYRWSVDVSVYVRERSRRAGIGRGLYESLFAALVLQGFYNAYAGIALPNPASAGLHEAMGFEPVGVYRDVGWWHRELDERSRRPDPPKTVEEIRGSLEWNEALATGASSVREQTDSRG